ncbi:phage holin family protein [Devriesea agamarum]|uniref:phage holin family protein n=1 Tax=Devriesea agamarum TaxID=472569 RepID=UPI00071DDE65|nr:phage holin family protein [Devriesea agamarum]
MIDTSQGSTSAPGHKAPTSTQRSIGELVGSIRDELVGVVHQEIAIAKKELKAQAIKAGIGIVGFLIALFLLLSAYVMLLFAAAWGLVALGLPHWAAFLIIAGVFIVLSLIAALIGLNRVKAVRAPETTIRTGKSAVNALKGTGSSNSVSYDDVFEDLYGKQVPNSK